MKCLLLLGSLLWAQTPPEAARGPEFREWVRQTYYQGKHHALGYEEARVLMYNTIDNDQGQVTCVYGGFQKPVPSGGHVSNPAPINAEHTIPQSFFGKRLPMKSDLHHLFPTYNRWNSFRSNYPFAEIPDPQTDRWMRGTLSHSDLPDTEIDAYSEATNDRFEPPEGHKGNVARAVFYFYSMYDYPLNRVGPLELFHAWNLIDPPDDAERTRNQAIEQVQGNRNPFIDHPEWASLAYPVDPNALKDFISQSGLPMPRNLNAALMEPGTITLDLIDVGTGLSLFIRGDDFSVLYDAGSNDDAGGGIPNSRVTAFLEIAHPDLEIIDHAILSHPHKDHLELLDEVFERYAVVDMWDSGSVNKTKGFATYMKVVRDEGSVLHSTRPEGESLQIDWGPEPFEVQYGPQIPIGEPLYLGKNATMTFLYGAYDHKDLNANSLVVRFDLNGERVLVMGDAEGGERKDWADGTPEPGTTEEILLSCCLDALKSNVLVVGHHGSKTSSRVDFLDAVGARTFLLSSGPKSYSGVVLPDDAVVQELKRRGAVWRTDLNDENCNALPQKIGKPKGPGGCSNLRMTINKNPGSKLRVAALQLN